MKTKISWFILLLVLMMHGCGSDSSSSSPSSFDTSNNAPVIKNVSTDANNYGVEQNTTDIVATVKENTRNAFKVEATDRSILTFALAGQDFTLFDIDTLSGEIFFREPTDYETKKTYKFKVVITDAVGNRTIKNVKIYVRNIIDEVAPIIVQNYNNPLSTTDESKYFITTWKTDNNNQVTIPTLGDGYNYSVDWGDGTSSKNITSSITHNYNIEGNYIVKISGTFPRIFCESKEINPSNLLSIRQWGKIKWTSMSNAFSGCYSLIGAAIDKPILSNVTDMRGMFYGAENFNQDIGDWNVSSVINMNYMFMHAVSFNQNINDWNVSNVTSTRGMFLEAKNFNQFIGDWNVSNVMDMYGMFDHAISFNKNIEDWDVSSVTNMSYMFNLALNFNKDIGGWDVSNVTDMSSMFVDAIKFNRNIESWNVSNVINMSSMFLFAKTFDQNMENWDVSNVTNMNKMFANASTFNQDIGTWNVSNVIDMSKMFSSYSHPAPNANILYWNSSYLDGEFITSSFNQDIESWNVSNVTDMSFMFSGAYALEKIPSWYHE